MYYGRDRADRRATATVKHPSMEGGSKLLLVMALQADGHTPKAIRSWWSIGSAPDKTKR